MHRSKQHLHSITLSAVASSAVGTSRPSAFAVFMLMASVNCVRCTMAYGVLRGPSTNHSDRVLNTRNEGQSASLIRHPKAIDP